MSRGVRKAPIFLTDQDRLNFLQRLDRALEETSAEALSFALMDNHNHFLLEGTQKALSRCMQRVNSLHARFVNDRTGVRGHLFQGPYVAYPARSDGWIARRAVYTHLNPVEAGAARDPLQYRWSSARAFLGGSCDLKILDPSKVLRVFGGSISDQRKRYSEIMRRSTQSCLERRRWAEEIHRRRPNGRSPGVEEVRVQVEQMVTLLGAIDRVLGKASLAGTHHHRARMLLAGHLSKQWALAPADVVAFVLGCTERNIRRIRQEALPKLAEDSYLHTLIREVQNEFLQCVDPSAGAVILPGPAKKTDS
jgi:REP element-mobilizing transposase RayT